MGNFLFFFMSGFLGSTFMFSRPTQKDAMDRMFCVVWMIAFFSAGFPLRQAQAYAALRRPHVFNDLEKQELLLDRRRVYGILQGLARARDGQQCRHMLARSVDEMGRCAPCAVEPQKLPHDLHGLRRKV